MPEPSYAQTGSVKSNRVNSKLKALFAHSRLRQRFKKSARPDPRHLLTHLSGGETNNVARSGVGETAAPFCA